MATARSYRIQKPTDWSHLADLAIKRMHGKPSPYPAADWVVYLGAHVALEEEQILNSPLWALPQQAIGLSMNYGVTLRAALRTSHTENYAGLMALLSTMHVPVPSAQAIINVAHRLKLDLKIAETDLRRHTLQHRPYFGGLHPRWPILAP